MTVKAVVLSLEIAQGLFGHNVTDYHAILGVPIGSDATTIRKRYLQIAPRLHPDTCPADLPDAKEQAKQLMSRLVNPAYATLSNDGKRAEHEVVLRLLHGQLPQQKDKVAIASLSARQLTTAPDVRTAYLKALNELAAKQYETLDGVTDRIAEASELNLVYLLRTATVAQPGSRPAAPPPPPPGRPAPPPTNAPSAPLSEPSTGGQSKAQFVDRALQRANELMAKGQWALAAQELKETIKLDGNNAACHALLGKAYVQQKQATMAKVHLSRALSLDPRNAVALAAKQDLDRLTGSTSTSGTSKTPAKTNSGKPPDKPSGGFLGGLFGGKKK